MNEKQLKAEWATNSIDCNMLGMSIVGD